MSNRTSSRRSRPWLRGLVGALLVLTLAEAAVRILDSRLEPVYDWPGDLLATHERQLAARGNDVDLLVVGSSSAGAAIRPDELAAHGVSGTGYNYYQAGPSMEAIAALASNVLLQRTTPSVVVVGLTMREFNAGPSQLSSLRSLEASPAYRSATGAASLVDRVDGWLQSTSALARHRSLLRDPASLWRDLRTPNPVPETVHADGSMDTTERDDLTAEPEAHRQQERQALAGFEVDADQLRALEELLDELDEVGARVLVVNLPVTDHFIEYAPDGRADYDEYVTGVRDIAHRNGARWLDAMAEPWPDRCFGDVNHLNDEGADRLRPMLVEALRS